MDIRAAEDAERRAVTAFVAEQQARSQTHIGYDASSPGAIAADFEALSPHGWGGVTVAFDKGQLVGVLATDWDTDPPRVWWHGPYAAAHDWDAIAEAVYAHALSALPMQVTQQELAPDACNDRVARFAQRHGFVEEVGSAVLSRTLRDLPNLPVQRARDCRITEVDEASRPQVEALHDRLFARTHTPGSRLLEGTDRVVLAAHRDSVVGYIAVERQAEGDGYIDFVGVTAAARARGIGGALVLRACAELRERFGCSSVHLTVQASNHSARRLYERLGFAEERVLVPWRRGWSRTGVIDG